MIVVGTIPRAVSLINQQRSSMKKLSLLMFAILILGCGSEKPVVEEPEPIGHPLVADGNVQHRQVNVDPEPLNEAGFFFRFTQDFRVYINARLEKDGKSLNRWEIVDSSLNTVHIGRWSDYNALQYDTEYQLTIHALDSDCKSTAIVIQFRTKPQRPVVGRPAPVIQERPPVVPSSEHFRLDPALPSIVAGDVFDGDGNVDPEPLNENGIQFEFDEGINRYRIDLRDEAGASLGWLPHGLTKLENPVPHIKIIPAEGATLLEFDTTYKIDIFVEDLGCWTVDIPIVFRTKPNP